MIKQLQARLPEVWTEESYSADFQKAQAKDKNFRHALLHTMKAIGKLVEMPEVADHSGVNANAYADGWAEKYLADILICTVRMASEHPLGAIDLDRAVRERLSKKLGLTLEARAEQPVLDERERCAKIAEAEPNLPGSMPMHVKVLVDKAIANGNLEEICRHFAGGMQKSIAKKIREV